MQALLPPGWAPPIGYANGLLAPAHEERPDLVLVVSDNDGGGIFSSLEQGALASVEVFERVFAVPLGLDLGALTRAHGIEAVVVDSAEDLIAAVDDALGAGGVRVVVARTCERDADAAMLVRVRDAVGHSIGTA